MRNIVRIGTWNTEWANPDAKPGTITSKRAKVIKDKLTATNCHILCVTEGCAGILPAGGHVIDAGAYWGYKVEKRRRKVLLWSKRPWTPHAHALGLDELHQGRFVAGTTETVSGEHLTVIGVCIPWRDSLVKPCKLLPWDDHERWLAGFGKVRYRFPYSRTVVLGDFNQRMPNRRITKGKYVPKRIHDALLRAFDGFQFATEGKFPGCRRAIDHIAHTPDLSGNCIKVWPECVKVDDALLEKLGLLQEINNWTKCKRFKCPGPPKLKLSDHFGVWGDFLVAG